MCIRIFKKKNENSSDLSSLFAHFVNVWTFAYVYAFRYAVDLLSRVLHACLICRVLGVFCASLGASVLRFVLVAAAWRGSTGARGSFDKSPFTLPGLYNGLTGPPGRPSYHGRSPSTSCQPGGTATSHHAGGGRSALPFPATSADAACCTWECAKSHRPLQGWKQLQPAANGGACRRDGRGRQHTSAVFRLLRHRLRHSLLHHHSQNWSPDQRQCRSIWSRCHFQSVSKLSTCLFWCQRCQQ